MAVLRNKAASDASGTDENLSEYEKLRLQKIQRNEQRLKELGLFQTKEKISSLQKRTKAKKEKSSKVSPELPQRRSSRKRKSVASYNDEQVIPMHSDEEEFEETDKDDDNDTDNDNDTEVEKEDSYEMSGDESEDDDNHGGDESFLRTRPTKKRKKNDSQKPSKTSKTPSTSATTETITAFHCVNPKGGLTLEYAKTGRSKCRKCGQKIEKDKPRVGMEAWIVGRNCVTWQCPGCLLENLCCVYEKSNGGRGRCKVTNQPFAKGQVKIGIRCHTATSYYHVPVVAGVLNNVVDLMMTDNDGGGNSDFKVTVESISGNEKLSQEDRDALESVLNTVSPNRERTSAVGTKGSPQSDSVPENDTATTKESLQTVSGNTKKKVQKEREQPKSGIKTNAKGKVEWKFGGHTCYGTLLPSKETKTHCYARTHKGNVKTLAKGKDYWSMVA
eukprot:jgi/Psemu1/289225/fgenesh1_pg.336_\